MPKYHRHCSSVCPISHAIPGRVEITRHSLVLEKSALFPGARFCHRTCRDACTRYIKCSLHSNVNYRSLCRNGIPRFENTCETMVRPAHGKRSILRSHLRIRGQLSFFPFRSRPAAIDRPYRGQCKTMVSQGLLEHGRRGRFSGFAARMVSFN